MKQFWETLRLRNELLAVFGLTCLIAALVCLALTAFGTVRVAGVNAWYKPFKFFLSSAIFCWSMGWYMHYLGSIRQVRIFSIVATGVLAFETIYIAWQAARGELSHFNTRTAFHGAMFALMGVAIVIMTLATAYIGLLFLQADFPALPQAYVWGIRMGIFLFVIFAFEGGLMASRMSHSVGGPDGGAGLPVINWSRHHGDLRIAHFAGMHALQVLPLFAYYVTNNVKAVGVLGVLYTALALLLLVQALQGKPLFR